MSHRTNFLKGSDKAIVLGKMKLVNKSTEIDKATHNEENNTIQDNTKVGL